MFKIVFAPLLLLLTASSNPETASDLFDSDTQGYQIERALLTEFDPTAEYLAPPKRGELVSAIDLSGSWTNDTPLDSTTLTFTARPDGGYLVSFVASGCLGQWELKRKGHYSGSTITLDSPVQEYAPVEYTTLHTISFRGEMHLLASAHVKHFDGKWGADENMYKLMLLSRSAETTASGSQE